MYTNPVPSEVVEQSTTVTAVLKEYLYWPYLLIAAFVVFLVVLVVIEVREKVKDHQEEDMYSTQNDTQQKSAAHEYRMPSGGWPDPNQGN